MPLGDAQSPESVNLVVLNQYLLAVYDIQVPETGVQIVTVPSGAWHISAAIQNPNEVKDNGDFIEWDDTSGVFKSFNPFLQLDRPIREVSTGMLTYPATRIRFPDGGSGVVSVVGPSGFAEPTMT